MTKETKILLLLDKLDEKKKELNKTYNANHTTLDSTPESILALNMWYTEEHNKLEDWFVNEVKKIFK